MLKRYLVKCEVSNQREVEKFLFMSMVDRKDLFAISWKLHLNGDDENVYFLVGGYKYSCGRVLGIAKKNLSKVNIPIQIINYESIRSVEMDELVILGGENIVGKVTANYSNPIYRQYYSRLTTQFVLKKKLCSNYVFCTNCTEGFGEPIELSSLRSEYKCSCCGHDINVDGPIVTNKVPVSHLSDEEKETLMEGLPLNLFTEEALGSIVRAIAPEQIIMSWVMDTTNIETGEQQTRRGRRHRAFKVESYIKDKTLQLCLQLI